MVTTWEFSSPEAGDSCMGRGISLLIIVIIIVIIVTIIIIIIIIIIIYSAQIFMEMFKCAFGFNMKSIKPSHIRTYKSH